MKNPADIRSQTSATTADSRNDLRGVLLPFTTPFKPNEEIDENGLRANIRKWNTTGVVGYVALGSTGERVHLDEREYAQVIEIARQEVGRDLALIAGAGQQSTGGTIDEIKRAAAMGADAVLVITPHYYRPAITQEALVEHYSTVADKSPVPVILYSMPDLTGIKIAPETCAQLASHQNIIGIKDSSADLDGLRETISLVPEDFAVLTGNGTVFCDALSSGARGAILAVGCVAPGLCVEIYDLVEAGGNERATALQQTLTPLALAVTKRYGIGGLKAAMEMAGFCGGAVRAPLKPASEEARAQIATLLEASGQITSDRKTSGCEVEFAGVVNRERD